ncbi:MAG: DUF126 domain-containing protein [Acidimicrobiales bacterium]|nr:DUF126 domain-containing protein [Acidimicrobiales bacterium]
MIGHGRVLHAGLATGPVIQLDEPLSFWGGFDPVTGTIIDRAHPQVGASLVGCIVAMPGSRGSSATPGALGEALRLGTGPAGLLVTKPDINLVAGAMVAATLYNSSCPVILVDEETRRQIRSGSELTISIDGRLT